MYAFRFGTTNETAEIIRLCLKVPSSLSWCLLDGLFQIIKSVSTQIVHLYHRKDSKTKFKPVLTDIL